MTSRTARRRAASAVVLLSAIGLLAACAPPPAPSANFTFKATSVTAVDQTEFISYVNQYDEPYLTNIWFRVKIGVPNSAQAGVVESRSAAPEPQVCKTGNQGNTIWGWCPSGTETYALTGSQQAPVTFSGISRPDILDLANGSKVEVAGVWTWAMEEDWVGSLTPGTLASLIQSVLNSTLATGSVPNDPNLLAQLIIDNLGDAIALGGSGLLDALSDFFLGIGDDLIGSRMYIFVGSRGTLAGIINAASIDLTGFDADLAAIGIPAVQGVTIRSTAAMSFTDQSFVGAGADHRYNFTTN